MTDDALPPDTDAALRAAASGYFADRRARVPAFTRRHFGLRGTLRLHRGALGADILRAPVNIVLAPLHLLIRLAALLCRLMRLPRVAAWLSARQVLLPTDVARAVERLIVTDLLELPAPGAPGGRDALAEALQSDPALRALIPGHLPARSLTDYSGTRSAVGEMTTALATLGAGAAVFKTLTPGVISIAPAVAAVLAHDAAIAGFPLGQTLGGVWYGYFPQEVPFWTSALSFGGLIVTASLFTAFAGIIADPVQTALGIHQRRLIRLIDALEDDFTGEGARAFAAREHYLARVIDIADAGISALRVFRG